MLEKIKETEQQKSIFRQGGGQKEIESQHKKGKLTARERVDLLMDPWSFHELDLWAQPIRTGFEIDERILPGDAVVFGYGRVNDRPVYCYAHDFTVAGGTQAAVQQNKVAKTIDTAVRMQIPYFAVIDSGGIRLQDLMGEPGWKPPTTGLGTGRSGSFMFSPSWASGVIPQICVMLGPMYAGSSYSPIMADFLIMRKSTAYMSLVSPQVIKEVTHEEVTQEEIGGAQLHSEVSGTIDLVVESDEEGIAKSKELLSFLPSNCNELPPVVKTSDSPNRREEELITSIPSDPAQDYDMHKIISLIVDNAYFFELKPRFAMNVIIGFSRMNGQTVGIVANNPAHKGGAIDVNSSDKEARFIRFCDAFNIPLIFLVDSVGYDTSLEQEREGIERHGSKTIYAVCEATVPKITIYIRNCDNFAELAMGTEQMGNDLIVAWPSARIGHIDAAQAVEIIYEKEIKVANNPDEVRKQRIIEFNSTYNTLTHAAALQLIQDIIDPRDTRKMIIEALEAFAKKTELMPWKKHGNIPL